MTKAKHSGAFKGHRFPPEFITYAVWSYFRFPLSLRDVEDLFAARGIIVSYETIRKWVENLVQSMPLPSGEIGLPRMINGTLMKWSFLSAGANSGFGARSTAMVTFLIFWFNLGATLAQRNAFFANYSKNTGDRAL